MKQTATVAEIQKMGDLHLEHFCGIDHWYADMMWNRLLAPGVLLPSMEYEILEDELHPYELEDGGPLAEYSCS